ncbi:RN216-like protein [Mya arenaria]|uniref:RN216-like protein n=1 Tax=Mya arenaria TaxID=6604 RepID=A0ABY7FBS7_MYAAR|nr:RN216-like protein [Mya arenaria]
MDEPVQKKLRFSKNNSNSTEPDSCQNSFESQENGTLEYDLDIGLNGDQLNEVSSSESVTINHDTVNDDSAENNIADTSAGTSLSKVESVVRDAKTITSVIPDVDEDDVYNKILQRRAAKNRIDIVTNEVLEETIVKQGGTSESVENQAVSSSSDELFKDVAEILIKHPDVDPSYVYDMLEKENDKKDRIDIVLKELLKTITPKEILNRSPEHSVSNSVSDSSVSASVNGIDLLSDPDFKKNPLYRDLRTLRKVLPDVNQNELYAYLEAHFYEPNRVQIVIDELTKSDSQESVHSEKETVTDDRGKAPQTAEDRLQLDFKALKDIIRDCDPNFLFEKLVTMDSDKERVHKIAAELLEKRDYPKLKDVLEHERQNAEKKRITEMKFDLQDFLSKFSDPFTYFENLDRPVSDNYKDHVMVYLKNMYPQLKAGYIKKVVKEKNHHLAPVVAEIDIAFQPTPGRRSKKQRMTIREHLNYPDTPDEPFFQEVLFCQNKRHIKDHLREVREQKNMKIDAARQAGELLECGCCYDDECLFEDMAACADGHIFCQDTLQSVLSPAVFSMALRKLQEEEIRQAGIPDLVACPFCSFATIMADPEDKLFRCLNPELCQEPNHIPLRCNEVEKQGVTGIRTFIEMKVSESMLRVCPKCHKRFYKLDGCNKMTCQCGTTMCYVCREPHIDYEHFSDSPGCNDDSNMRALHRKEMMKAAEEASSEYFENHPDLDLNNMDIDLSSLVDNILKGNEENQDDYYDDEGDADGD